MPLCLSHTAVKSVGTLTIKQWEKCCAWFAHSSFINIKIYAKLREMCEDAPSSHLAASWVQLAKPPRQRLGGAQEPPGSILLASYIQKSGAQEGVVCE